MIFLKEVQIMNNKSKNEQLRKEFLSILGENSLYDSVKNILNEGPSNSESYDEKIIKNYKNILKDLKDFNNSKPQATLNITSKKIYYDLTGNSEMEKNIIDVLSDKGNLESESLDKKDEEIRKNESKYINDIIEEFKTSNNFKTFDYSNNTYVDFPLDIQESYPIGKKRISISSKMTVINKFLTPIHYEKEQNKGSTWLSGMSYNTFKNINLDKISCLKSGFDLYRILNFNQNANDKPLLKKQDAILSELNEIFNSLPNWLG
jgi:hypothetical protein